MKVSIVVDHFQRDLNGYLALIDKLIDDNIKVNLIHMYHIYEIFLIESDLIILHNLRPEALSIANILKKLGKKIIIIDNEGVPFGWTKGEQHIDEFCKTISKNLDKVDGYVVWGEYIKKKIFFHPKENDKVKVYGNQRFELFKKKYNFLFSKRKTKKKVIILNTNFVNSNPNFTNKKQDIKNIREKIYGNNPDKNKLTNNFVENNKAIFENYINLIEKILEDFIDFKVIINVHPFENKQFYKKKFKKYKNFITLNNNFLLPKLYNNYDFIIQYNSTTCAETLLGGKRSISVNFVDPNQILNNYYKDYVYNFNSYDDLKKFLKKYDNSEVLKIDNETLDKLNYLHYNAKNDSIKLISEYLKNNFSSKKGSINEISKIKKNILATQFYFFFKYTKNDFLIFPYRFLKFIFTFIVNSKNFYLLKSMIYKNYEIKKIRPKVVKNFLEKLNDKNIYEVKYKKADNLSLFFRDLVAIEIIKKN